MTKTKSHYWFFVGLIGVLLAAPNATVIKYSLGEIDPFLFNTLRFLAIALITLPFLIKDRKLINKTNFKQAILAGFFMAAAVMSYVWGIKLSQASYVSIVTLITPIIFILLSAKLTGEKISNKSVAGITIAAIGALIIIVLPVALKQSGEFIFYPLATLFILLNCISFPLAMIYFKKSNESGIPMPSLLSISSFVVCISNAMFLGTVKNTQVINGKVIFGIIYSGIVVALISRALNLASYEHIGSVVVSALNYLETLVAILLPIIILDEKLSTEMVIGGILILIGVYVVEYHKSAHHKHHHAFRSH
ncbi:DMT family transporter [Candidatus Saccharibacteria bacterium]|nr:DMT family transporter [Candidatus Saccharibacteria bacterium]